MRIGMIAALDRGRVIGRDGDLPWKLPDDLSRFMRITRGHAVVMGRRTWESIGGKPLKNRVNIVLSRSASALEGAELARTAEEAIELAARRGASELWVIGGAAVYEAFLARADVLELTHVDADVEGDVRFPAWDAESFRVSREEAHPADERHAHAFRFVSYERVLRNP